MKSKQFAFSFDRETFDGRFATRAEALSAGLARAAGLADVLCVHVGEVIDADPQTTDHADLVLKRMHDRAQQVYGDTAAGYCRKVNDQEAALLDDMLAATIDAWLKKTDRQPTFCRFTAVSEHPIPPTSRYSEGELPREVSQLGEE
jgi:hypothetical protein